MGTYTALSVDGYEVYSSKSAVEPLLMTVFAEADRRVRTPANDELGATAGPWRPRGLLQRTQGDESDPLLDHAYVASARHVRDRLEVMGFTLRRARAAYEAGRAAQLEERRNFLEEADEPSDRIADEVRILEALTFDAWVAGFHWAKERGAHALSEGEIPEDLKGYLIPRTGVPEHVQFLLDEDQVFGEGFNRFWATDPRQFLRGVLETCGSDALVVQNISELVHGGYYGEYEEVAAKSREQLTVDFPVNARIVVLTEGSTDQRFLEQGLALLYPHLVDYYSFMDFDGMAVRGGAGALVATVKAFAGAGITNRIVALFDNDTAGRDAARQLAAVALPPNYRVLTYPPLPSARAWPTLGPTGTVSMDVNGLAGSIELYLGEDVLRSADGLEPVQWRGLVESVGQYQGELIRKTEVQRRFREKLKLAQQDRAALDTLDWSGIRAVLNEVLRAFQ